MATVRSQLADEREILSLSTCGWSKATDIAVLLLGFSARERTSANVSSLFQTIRYYVVTRNNVASNTQPTADGIRLVAIEGIYVRILMRDNAYVCII